MAKKIKTILSPRKDYKEFDQKVNAALADGWKLVDRFVDPGCQTSNYDFYPVLMASLEKEVDDNGD